MTDLNKTPPLRKIRSFVRRDGRLTSGQRRALDVAGKKFGLALTAGLIDFKAVFNRAAPHILEIGFGSGHSLLAMAKAHPEEDFIGIETHQPGIGTLLLNIEAEQVTNIRIYYADAIEVLTQCIPDQSLDTVQIFFPDPWPKRRHHKRRLIQAPVIKLIAQKLKSGGTLHLATDWQDYANQMMKVITDTEAFKNLAGPGQFSERSSQRPLITKFEQRGEESGRPIWELQFENNP